MEKVCIKCENSLTIDNFTKNKSKKDGLNIYCKKCSNNECAKYRSLNNPIIKTKRKLNYEKNKEEIKTYHKEYRKINPNMVKESYKKWLLKNPDYFKKYIKHKKMTDPVYNLKSYIRTLVYNSLKNKGYIKSDKSFKIIGCSPEFLKEYIEQQFLPWMNWSNHGLYNGSEYHGWDIDHIIPLSSAKTEEDVLRLNHYTNLQPLCSKINRDVKRNIFIN